MWLIPPARVLRSDGGTLPVAPGGEDAGQIEIRSTIFRVTLCRRRS